VSQVIKVLNESEAREAFGGIAKEMRVCPACEKQQGVLIGEMGRMEHKDINQQGKPFDRIIWERWRCLGCGNIWAERYAVRLGVKGVDKGYKGSFGFRSPVRGVVKPSPSVYNTTEGGL